MSSLTRTPATPAPATAGTPVAPAAGAAADAPVRPGSRLESAWMARLLAGDLLSTPFHLLGFLCTRGRQKQRLLDALRESAR